MADIDDAAGREHDIEVEVAAQALPQLEGVLVEQGIARQQIVRAHDGGVAAGIAAADIALLQNRDVMNAVIPGEIIGCGEAMAAAADDDDPVFLPRLRVAPRPRPADVAAERVAQDLKTRISANRHC